MNVLYPRNPECRIKQVSKMMDGIYYFFITKNLNLNKRKQNSTVRDALLSNLLL